MTNKPEAAPAPAEVQQPPQVVPHPDEVARELIALAAQRGYGISQDGFALTRNLGNMVATYSYKG